MKINRRNNEENKTTNTQSRRRTMKATKLIMIICSVTAMIMGGCSKGDRITGPDHAAIAAADPAPVKAKKKVTAKKPTTKKKVAKKIEY
jgi:hypothetical protein